MWGIITTIFLALYCVMSFYIGRRGWTTLAKPSTAIFRGLYWILFGILIFSFPLTEFAEDYLSEAGGWFTIWGWYSMLAVVYIFLLLLIIDLLRLVDKRISFSPQQ